MTAATLSLPTSNAPRLRRFSVDEYLHLTDTGFFNNGERLELLDGWIVEKMPHNAPHDHTLMMLQFMLYPFMLQGYTVRGQSSIVLDTSIPEPDVALLAGPLDRYHETRPIAKDVHMLMEVSDSSLPSDQDFKLRLYARNKIPVYWIVNLIDKRVEVYTQPQGDKNPTYRSRTDYFVTDIIPVTVAGQTLGTIPVNEFLPQ